MTDDDISDAADELRFNVTRSIRYHDKRRAFFDIAQKGSTVISLITSSGAVIALLNSVELNSLAIWLSAITAAISAISVVFEFTNKYALYSDLKGRFLDLETEINACIKPSQQDIVRLVSKRKEIERYEPAISEPLNLLCYNEAIDALGWTHAEKKPLNGLQVARAYTYLF